MKEKNKKLKKKRKLISKIKKEDWTGKSGQIIGISYINKLNLLNFDQVFILTGLNWMR